MILGQVGQARLRNVARCFSCRLRYAVRTASARGFSLCVLIEERAWLLGVVSRQAKGELVLRLVSQGILPFLPVGRGDGGGPEIQTVVALEFGERESGVVLCAQARRDSGQG